MSTGTNIRQVQQQAPQGGRQARWVLIRGAPRIVSLGLLTMFILGVFGLRLWNLQFVQGEEYSRQAERQSTRLITVPAPRGIIYDSNGTPLVRNVPSFNVVVIPAYLPGDENEDGYEDEAEDVLIRLAMLLNMPYATPGARGEGDEPSPGLREIVKDAGFTYRPVVVKRGVERSVALLVAQQSLLLPGVLIEVESAREYPDANLLSQVLGYLLPVPDEEAYINLGYEPAIDRVGVAGVEASYEDVLRGVKGLQVVEEDVLGRVVRVVEEPAVRVPGHNVYLTLDRDLQEFVEGALRAGMEKPNANSPRGVAIVMNPQTGEVLAMVSLPTYDNNLFTPGVSVEDRANAISLYEDVHRPMLNHAISDRLQPGSVFKIVVAAGALQEGVLNGRYTRLNCPGEIVVPNKYAPNDPGLATPFHCWNRSGHGWLDVVDGIAHSCNIFFYKVGGGFEEDNFDGLGVDNIAHYAQLFGFGQPTGVELIGEISGTVPTRDWKRLTFGESWNTGNTYHMAIGEGFLEVTPLQMLNAVNVVANGGTLYRPLIVHHVTDAEGRVTQPFEPEIIRTLPISSENWSLIQQGMEGAVEYGTSQRTQIEGLRVAGKTGTAQYCDDIAWKAGDCEGRWPEHAWFAAYASLEDAEEPEVSVVVFLYHGGEGSTMAVPVAHDILAYYFGLDTADEGNEATP
ncbi:MAG: penicillin-binding protein 2 [Chloroflexota bacterium]|nr:penicillin-binding protein 2 [Chloroflexota bacterium]